MAGTTITMSQLKQILQFIAQGYSLKRIASETSTSRNTIKGYLRAIKSREINLEETLKLEDPVIEQCLRGSHQSEQSRRRDFMTRLDRLVEELKHPHVTKQLLWEEYKHDNAQGYQYSRFCYYLQLYDKSSRAVLVGHHEPGDKLYVDFTGDKLHYVDRYRKMLNEELF